MEKSAHNSTMFVTGAAGFIGSNLVDRLLADGHTVVGWDNFSTGFRENLDSALKNLRFRLVEGDTLDLESLVSAMSGATTVWHLAANADVRFGLEAPSRDIQQNTLATFHVLEAVRRQKIKKLIFASTGSVYGEAKVIPTPEDCPFPQQTSLYGASKLAGEGLIQAYAEGYGLECFIFRFVSILGNRYSHGHVYDFYLQLQKDPTKLRVLGDGKQRKSYLCVSDCVSAMLHAVTTSTSATGTSIFNLGTGEYCQVLDSVSWICQSLGVSPQVELTGGDRGWIGDNPFIFLDTKKICSTGWVPKFSIQESILQTLSWLRANPWVFEQRK